MNDADCIVCGTCVARRGARGLSHGCSLRQLEKGLDLDGHVAWQ